MRRSHPEDVCPLGSAAVVGVPGIVVIATVTLAYLGAIGFAYRPRERQVKGERFQRDREGEWEDERYGLS